MSNSTLYIAILTKVSNTRMPAPGHIYLSFFGIAGGHISYLLVMPDQRVARGLSYVHHTVTLPGPTTELAKGTMTHAGHSGNITVCSHSSPYETQLIIHAQTPH